MAIKSRKQNLKHCPECGQGPLKRRRVDKTFKYGDEEARVTVTARRVPVEVCPGCGEFYFGPEAARAEQEAICRSLGLLTPAEIRQVREGLGLTLEEFARLTGIGVATVSRWESGRMVQNRAMDRYLRLLARGPQNIRLLKELVPSNKA